MAEWIDVKDRLPDVGARVLTLSKYNRISDRELYKFRYGEFIFRPDGMKPISDITHWMPLPESPRTPKERGLV